MFAAVRFMAGELGNDFRENLFGFGLPAGRRRTQRRLIRPRRDVDDLVAALLQRPQQGRQHCRGRGAAVVQKQDAALRPIEPLQDEVEFGLRRQQQPVGGPEIRPEDADVAALKPGDERRRIGEAWKAEERDLSVGAAVGGLFVGSEAAVDIGAGGGIAHQPQGFARMRKRMIADRMAFGDFAPRQRRIGLRVAADEEEGRLHAFLGEGIEHFRRRRRPGTVVEGQDDFVIAKRQGARIGLQADGKAACGRKRKRALGAELVRPAGWRGDGACRPRSARQREGQRADAPLPHEIAPPEIAPHQNSLPSRKALVMDREAMKRESRIGLWPISILPPGIGRPWREKLDFYRPRERILSV